MPVETLNFNVDSNQWNIVTGALHAALLVRTCANRLPNAHFYLKCNHTSIHYFSMHFFKDIDEPNSGWTVCSSGHALKLSTQWRNDMDLTVVLTS